MRSLSRRQLLGAGAGLALAGMTSCGTRADARRTNSDDPWQQFQGTTLNFISENTAPTAAIAANLRPFTELTGIRINIVTLELSALVQKVALDLAWSTSASSPRTARSPSSKAASTTSSRPSSTPPAASPDPTRSSRSRTTARR
jgi:hypothetical protein